jgi:hypothetical protein
VLRFLLWRMLGLFAAIACAGLVSWFLGGGPGQLLRARPRVRAAEIAPGALASSAGRDAGAVWGWEPVGGTAVLRLALAAAVAAGTLIALARGHARHRRCYRRFIVAPYRGDHADADALLRMFEALHKRLLRRWWRRLLLGQPSVSLEVHHGGDRDAPSGWLAVSCPEGLERMVETALRAAYPSCRLRPCERPVADPPVVLRLKKHLEFVVRARVLDRFEHERDPPVNRLLTVMAGCGGPAFVQLALTPTPAAFEGLAKRAFKSRETRLARERREHVLARDRSMLDEAELRGGLEAQHRSLFFLDLRVVAGERERCERIASELRIELAENRLVERGTAIRHGLLGLYGRRVRRGEGNPLPSFRKGVFATSELPSLWQLPSLDYLAVPFARSGVPLAPAPPAICRPTEGGTLRDSLGAVSIAVELRKQNTAVPGAVEQGKSSYLVASVAEDVRRERCAVIVLDPKGDAAEAALSAVPLGRTCTLLDFAHPTCGFNPLAVDAPADVIADYVVAALKNLFTDADIRASSDRYLRNAIIAVLAHDRSSNLWDAARLLSVGEEGYAYRASVGARVRTLPEFKEISQFFTAELTAQLADSRATTTAKLDAPVNKLARLLNSPSIKRVLLNDALRVDLDRVIANEEILVVKGALGAMGAGNTSVLMQLLVGMLDAALARQQDLVSAGQRIAVALKIDEAPLVLNRGFAETMALKRSAGLETVACWQTDSQWIDRDVREQLDALFAHRVYFATSSASDARSAVALTMAEFSDTVRPGVGRLSALGHPDVRLHLPKHHAVASWLTGAGRQSSFIARTLPMALDHERLAAHAAAQRLRGARHRSDLRQPHWDRPPAAQPAASERTDSGSLQSRSPATVASPQQAAARLPDTPAHSYRELVELDGTHSARAAMRRQPARELEPDPLDLAILASIASLRHLLSSQVHRHHNAGRASSTTQRRLKRLADAGLVERFQFHRRDGGGVPMAYRISEAGLRALAARDGAHGGHGGLPPGPAQPPPKGGDAVLRQARRDIHVAGWVLALLERIGGASRALIRGPEQATLHVPRSGRAQGRSSLGPAELLLPGGRAAHDFLRADSTGSLGAVDRFDSLRPDAIVELDPRLTQPGQPIDLLIEFDDRLPDRGAVAKLERYDHFLTGWSVHTRRYGERLEAVPLAVFICRDRARARACARSADTILRASRAYAGEYPFDWEYQGRERTLFVAERDIHERLLLAYGIPRLPPEVRVAAAHGDRRAAEVLLEQRSLLPTGEEAGIDPFAR